MNGVVVEQDLLSGEAIELVIGAGAGLSSFVAWSASCEYISLLVVGKGSKTLDAQRGQVATSSVFCAAEALLYIRVVAKERLASQDDVLAIESASRLLHSNACDGELSAKSAWSLARCAWLSSTIQSFVEDGEEFCVFKRKLAVSSKKLTVPEVHSATTAIDLLGEIHAGSKTWKQSSGSFSTLMRFLQKTKEEFGWNSESLLEGPIEIPL